MNLLGENETRYLWDAALSRRRPRSWRLKLVRGNCKEYVED